MDADSGTSAAILYISPSVRRADGIHLRLAGDIDMTTGDQFSTRLRAALDEPGVKAVTIDFGDLHFVDSNGVTALIRAHWNARERGITLTVVNVGGPIRETLQMLGVYDMLTTTIPLPSASPEQGSPE